MNQYTKAHCLTLKGRFAAVVAGGSVSLGLLGMDSAEFEGWLLCSLDTADPMLLDPVMIFFPK